MSIELAVTSDTRSARQDLAKLREAVEGIRKSTDSNANSFKQYGNNITASLGQVSNASNVTSAQLKKLDDSVQGIKAAADSATSSFKNFMSSIVTFGAITGATMALIKVNDELTSLNTKLRLVSTTAKDAAYAFEDVQRIALATRQEMNGVADLFTKIKGATQGYGYTSAQVARVVESVSKSLALSGGSAEEAKSAILQLGQALGSGRLSGDELRSLMENAQDLTRVIAQGMNVTVDQLRSMGEEGKLTTEKIFKAIYKSSEAIDERFKKVNVTFGQAFTNLGNSFKILMNGILNGGGSGDGTGANTPLGRIAKAINDGALAIAKFGQNLDFYLLKAEFKLVSFAETVYKSFTTLPSMIDKSMKGAAGALGAIDLNVKVKQITVDDVFKGLGVALDTVKGWVNTAERAFFWLYDRVIGHSWIPDLVEGVHQWVSKLPQTPLTFIMQFVEKAEKAFFWLYDEVIGHSWIPDLVIETGQWLSKLSKGPLDTVTKFVGAVSATFGLLSKLNPFTSLFKSIALIGAVTAAVFGLKKMADTDLEIKISDKALDTLKNVFNSMKEMAEKIPSVFGDFSDSISRVFGKLDSSLTDFLRKRLPSVENSMLYQSIRQVFGMKATEAVPYTEKAYPGRTLALDTNAHVGRGPMRSSENRGPIHDALNALPMSMQLPLIGTVTALFAGGLMLAFKEGTVRTALLSLLTTGAGIVAAKNVDDKEISRTVDFLGAGIVHAIQDGFHLVFGEGIVGEKGIAGTLSLIAKTALLFKSGREYLGNAAVNAVTAPTALARNAVTALEARYYNRQVNNLTAQRDNITANANNQLNTFTQRLTTANNQLAAVQQTNNVQAISAARQRVTAAQNNVNRQQAFVNNLDNMLRPLNTRLTALTETSTRLNGQLAEMRQNAAAGFTRTAAGIGGIFGSIGGYNLGLDYATSQGMSDKAQMAYAIGGAAIGQAVVASLTSAAATIGLAIGGALMTALTSIPGMIAVAIAAAAYVAFNWDTIGPVFYQGLEELKKAAPVWFAELKKLGKVWLEEFRIGIKEFLKKYFPSTSNELDKKESIDNGMIRLGRANKVATDVTSTGAEKAAAEAEMKATLEDIRKNQASLRQDGRLGNYDYDPEAAIKFTRTLNDFTTNFDTNLAGNLRDFGIAIKEFPGRLADDFIKLWDIFQTMPPTTGPYNGVARASGGWISGPGGPKDDKIPALLSNGEFVVNAASANANRGLLEAINSGIPFAKYANGTPSTDAKNVYLGKMKDLAEKYDINPQFFINIITQESSFNPNAISSSGASGIAQFTRGTGKGYGLNIPPESSNWENLLQEFKKSTGSLDEAKVALAEYLKFKGDDRFNPDKALDASAHYLSDMLKKYNGNYSMAAAAYKEGPGVVDSARASTGFWLDNMKASDTKTYVQKAQKGISDSVNEVQDVAKSAASATDKATDALSKFMKHVMEMFGKGLNLVGIDTSKQKTTNTYSGVEGSPDFVGPPVSAINKTTRSIVEGTTTSVEALNKIAESLEKMGVKGVDASLLANMDVDQVETIVNRIDLYFSSLDKAANASNEYFRTTFSGIALRTADELRKAMPKIMREAEVAVKSERLSAKAREVGQAMTTDLQNGFESGLTNILKGTGNLKDLGKSLLDKFTSNVLSTFSKGITDTIFNQISDGALGRGLNNLFGKVFDMPKVESPLDTAGVTYQAAANTMLSAANTMATAAGTSPAVAGAAASNIGTKASIGGGSGKTDKTIEKTTDESMKNTEDVTKDQTWSLSNVFEGGFDGLSKTFKSVMPGMSLGGALGGAFGGSKGAMWGSLIGAGINYASNNWASIAALFAADGGYISGPGTGTSDSIAAMLSNGEYVINAKSTAAHLPLLEAINSGKVPKFASGGVVGVASTSRVGAMVASGAEQSRSAPSQQVFNIHVTGDVSRQTRSEIQKMIPQIATGVNSHNYEKGIRSNSRF